MRVLAVTTCVTLSGFATSTPLQPPSQTSAQRALIEAIEVLAVDAHAHARPQLLSMLSDKRTRQFLGDLLPDKEATELLNLPPSLLLDRISGELLTAELVHSFGDADPGIGNCGIDLPLNVAFDQGLDAFYNLWQLQSLMLVPPDSTSWIMEWCEVNLFGATPFEDFRHPDFETASDRVFYTALNMYRGSAGNPQCGPISVVLSQTYLQNQAIMAPVDTGYYRMACVNSTEHIWDSKINCTGWKPSEQPLGVPPFFNHLIPSFLHFNNSTRVKVGDDYPYYNLARLVVRLISRSVYRASLTTSENNAPYKLNFVENEIGYIEVNPAASIALPRAIKLVIASFDILWHTAIADKLRKWCIRNDWPLAFAFNPAMGHRCGGLSDAECRKLMPEDLSAEIDPANLRILDPVVLKQVSCGHNVTVARSLLMDFQEMWNRPVLRSSHPKSAQWEEMRRKFAGTPLGIEPLFFNACASLDCIGVTISSGVCICPSKVAESSDVQDHELIIVQ